MFRLIAAETELKHEEPEILFNFAPFIVKQTWYGEDNVSGEIGSSLSPMVPNGDNDHATLPGIGCTLFVRNRNKTMLPLDKVPLNTGILAIYESNGNFICDDPVIDVYGKEFNLSIKPAKASLLTPAGKSEMGETLIHRGTQIIKNLTRF
jgi:hypothetical protein